jgi:hypothetical protein
MGRSKLSPQSKDTLLEKMSKMLVPSYILEDFDIYDAIDCKEYYEIELREKESKIPATLDGEIIVLDGYCNPLDMLSHSFICKPVRLKIYRRRYKKEGRDKHYSNEYDLTLKGVKMVPELGLFLKTDN